MSHADEITVTNDGATILKSLSVDNPAAKVLIGMRRPQQQRSIDRTLTHGKRCTLQTSPRRKILKLVMAPQACVCLLVSFCVKPKSC
jgi:T-complex protein 1 subunit beta